MEERYTPEWPIRWNLHLCQHPNSIQLLQWWWLCWPVGNMCLWVLLQKLPWLQEHVGCCRWLLVTARHQWVHESVVLQNQRLRAFVIAAPASLDTSSCLAAQLPGVLNTGSLQCCADQTCLTPAKCATCNA